MREERVSLSHIFISTAGLDAAGQAAARKEGQGPGGAGEQGREFRRTGQQNSDDAATAQQDGGALPPFTRKATIGPGAGSRGLGQGARLRDRSDQRIDGGFEILRVNEHQKAGLASFEEVQQEVQNKLFQPRYQPAYRGYLTKLRESAFLEIKPGYEDSGAAPNKDTAWIDPAELKPETIKKEEVLAQTHRKHIFGHHPDSRHLRPRTPARLPRASVTMRADEVALR